MKKQPYKIDVKHIPDLHDKILTCGNCGSATFHIGTLGSVACANPDCRSIMEPAPKRIFRDVPCTQSEARH